MSLVFLIEAVYLLPADDSMVVVARGHRVDVMKKKEKEGFKWLDTMLTQGRVLFADDFLDLLEYGIEGEGVNVSG